MHHYGDWAYGPLMKALAFAVLWPGCQQRLSWKNQKRRTVSLLTRLLMQQTCSSTHLCVKRRAVFLWSLLALRVNSYYGRTNGEKIDERWGAAKDNEIKIFKIITLTRDSLNVYICPPWNQPLSVHSDGSYEHIYWYYSMRYSESHGQKTNLFSSRCFIGYTSCTISQINPDCSATNL